MKNIPAFVAACAGMLLFGVSLITLGSVATELKAKFQLDDIGSGTLFSLLPFGILAGSLLFGPICDRYGFKTLLVIACAGMFVGFEGLAYSKSEHVLRICIFIFGVGGGVINGATNAVVADISDEHKGANLSLLGIFFGLGALGMPLLLGMVSGTVDSFAILAGTGLLTLVVGISYVFVRFPPPKQSKFQRPSWSILIKPLLVLIGFFLFCQSSFEAIINNWTTTYLTTRGVMDEQNALYGLSLHIVGMVLMRLVMGTALRKISPIKTMWICLLLLMGGIYLMQMQESWVVLAGLFLSGAGLAAGFPLMLGIVGEHFSNASGTAFGFVFSIALIGNMLINYLAGLIIYYYGISKLITISFAEIIVMAILLFVIARKSNQHR